MQAIMSGECTDAQIAAYLVALRLAGETADVIAGSAQAMREAVTEITHTHDAVVDTCGTGGDGAHTFNISTTVAFVVAGAGVPVAKHGNRGVSSKSGSADVLTELGVDISVSPEVMEQCLADIGIAFLFAPSLHPAMKHAIGPRREIGIRTVFNVLGPLTNPAGAKRGVLGVYDPALVPMLTQAAADLGAQHLYVVHGNDGLDEFTTTTTTTVGEVIDGNVTVSTLDPSELGLATASTSDLGGGEPAENAGITRAILSGEDQGPKRDIVLLNAAAAICAGGKAASIQEGLVAAAQSIDSGAALEKLNALAQRTQQG